jgi:hypothetical protein
LKSFVTRFATPLTTGLFAVSAVSGVALFFRWAPGAFHAMHEWLSHLLLLPFGFHVWRNWSGLVSYARRGTLLLPLAATIAVAVPFAAPALLRGSGGQGSPPARAMRLLTQTPLITLAPVLKTTPDALQAELTRRGYKVASLSETLETVAAASGVPATKLIVETLPPS